MPRLYRPDEYKAKLDPIFAQLKIKILTAFPAAGVEHIGSSAITGALSKGDLDVLVRVQKSELPAAIAAMRSIGFEIKPDTHRTDELCMMTTQEFTEDVAIQIIAAGSEFEDFIKFRDRLNANPALAADYNALKQEASALTDEAYRAKKSTFISAVLSRKN